MNATTFYAQAQPIVEQLATMAREWRDAAPTDPAAIEAHGEFFWLAARVDIRAARGREHDSGGIMAAQPGGKA